MPHRSHDVFWVSLHHWIGWRENLNRKPWVLPLYKCIISGFSCIFPCFPSPKPGFSMVFPLNMGGSWQFHPTTSNSQDDASYTVGVALYDAAGQRLCVGSSGPRAPQAEMDWWLQVPLQGCPLLPPGMEGWGSELVVSRLPLNHPLLIGVEPINPPFGLSLDVSMVFRSFHWLGEV